MKKLGLFIAVIAVTLFSGCSNVKDKDGWYDEGSVTCTYTYYSSLKESSAEIYAFVGNNGKFTITGVTLTVSFYDKSTKFIGIASKEAVAFIDTGDKEMVRCYFFDIAGEVYSYELMSVSYKYSDYSSDNTPLTFLTFYSVILGILIIWLLLIFIFNAKRRFCFHDGHVIEIYAGWVNNYLKVDNTIVDEIKLLFHFHYIVLTCEVLKINVKIGNGLLGNTISCFIDGKKAVLSKTCY